MQSGNLKILFFFVVLSSTACVETEQKPARAVVIKQEVKGPACEPPTVEVQGLLDFISSASYHTLDDGPYVDASGEIVIGCGLRSDVAHQLKRGRFGCLDEIANVEGVGEGTLRSIVSCGRSAGVVPPELYQAFEQAKPEGDITVAFTVQDNETTTAFVNGASSAELDNVPGIGPVLATRLIAQRPHHNVFWLRHVEGIGVTRLTALKDTAASWTPSVEETTWTDDLSALDPALASRITELLIENEEQSEYMFPVVFAGVYIHTLNGAVTSYDVEFVQMIDREGGIQLYSYYVLNASFEVLDLFQDV